MVSFRCHGCFFLDVEACSVVFQPAGCCEKSEGMMLHNPHWNHSSFLEACIIISLPWCSEISVICHNLGLFPSIILSTRPFQTRNPCPSFLGNCLGLFPDYFSLFSLPLPLPDPHWNFIFWMISVTGLIWFYHLSFLFYISSSYLYVLV